jgi:hypothetical protein
LAPEWFELGNELFYKYNPKPGPGATFSAAYARGVKKAYQAVKAANSNVKILACADTDNGGQSQYNTMVDGWYSGVSDYHNYVDGFVFHIYGPMSGNSIQRVGMTLSRLASHGAPSTIGVYFTEDGIATNNGGTMSPDNYGYTNPATYAQAGSIIRQKVIDIQANTSWQGQTAWGTRAKLWTHYQARDQTVGDNEREHHFGVTTTSGGNKGDLTQCVRDHAVAY